MVSKDVTVGFDFTITVVFVIVALIFLFPNNRYIPLDRRLAGLIGSALCTLLIWIFPQKTPNNTLYDIDVQVLLVLIAIMAINFVIMRQPMLLNAIKSMQHCIRRDPNSGFWLVSFISFIVSPFIMNDGLCLLLVTPVLDAFSLHDEREIREVSVKHSSHDPYYFMLAIACSANIGSATTFSGNPQNIIVAQYLGQYMNCGEFFGLLIIPAVVCWLLVTSLINYYRISAATAETAGLFSNEMGIELRDMTADITIAGGNSISSNGNSKWSRSHKFIRLLTGGISAYTAQQPRSMSNGDRNNESYCDSPVVSPLCKSEVANNIFSQSGSPITTDNENQERDTGIATERIHLHSSTEEESVVDSSDIGGRNNRRRTYSTGSAHELPSSAVNRLEGGLGLFPPSSQQNMEPVIEMREPVTVELPSGAQSIVAFAFFALLIALEFSGLFLLSSIFTLIAICLVVSVLLVNYYMGHPKTDEHGRPYTNEERIVGIAAYTEELFLDLDWNILVIFVGLFMVSGSFVHTGIPGIIWRGVAGDAPFQSASSLILISIYVAISSQLVGNVAVVYMARDQVDTLPPDIQKLGWCLLAWVSTIAGNLTLTGSAANIIVAEKAARHKSVPVLITPQRHFYICGPVTVVCLAVGVIIIYFESITIM